MANITLAISDELQRKMKGRSEVRWSEVAREAFEERVRELDWMDRILRRSQFSEKDAEDIGHEIKSEIWGRFRKRFSV